MLAKKSISRFGWLQYHVSSRAEHLVEWYKNGLESANVPIPSTHSSQSLRINMLSPIALATLAAATLGVAAPTSMSHNSDNTTLIEVFERATPAPVSCGRMFIDEVASVKTSTDDVPQRSATNALGHNRLCRTLSMQQRSTSTNPTNRNVCKIPFRSCLRNHAEPLAATFGSKYYPHRYALDGRSPDVDAALKAVPECVPVDGWAHWLFPIADPTYSGGKPNEDRIVMFAKGTQSPYTDFTFCLAISHRDQANNAFVPCA